MVIELGHVRSTITNIMKNYKINIRGAVESNND